MPHPEIGSLEKVAEVPSGCCTLGAGKAQVMGNEVQWGISRHRDRIVPWPRGRTHWDPFLGSLGSSPLLSANNPHRSPFACRI